MSAILNSGYRRLPGRIACSTSHVTSGNLWPSSWPQQEKHYLLHGWNTHASFSTHLDGSLTGEQEAVSASPPSLTAVHNTPWPQKLCLDLGLAPVVLLLVSTHQYQLTIMSSDRVSKTPWNHETLETQPQSTLLTWARMQTLTPYWIRGWFHWEKPLVSCQSCIGTVNCYSTFWKNPTDFYQGNYAQGKIK